MNSKPLTFHSALCIWALTLAFITSTFAGFSQSEAVSRKGRFIGLNFTPEYSYRTLTNTNGASTYDSLIRLRDGYEKALPGFTTGISFGYQLSNKLYLQTGLQFSKKGFRIPEGSFYYGDITDPRRAFIYNTNDKYPKSGINNFRFFYLDVPLKLSTSWGTHKLKLVAGAGVVTSIFLKESRRDRIVYSDDTRSTFEHTGKEKYSKVMFSPTVSAGIDWNHSGPFHLRVEPTFTYGISKIIDQPISAYLWSFGLNLGYYVSF